MSGEARNVAVEESKVGSQISDDTLVVLEFSPKAPAETKEWLTALVKSPGVLHKTLRLRIHLRCKCCYSEVWVQVLQGLF